MKIKELIALLDRHDKEVDIAFKAPGDEGFLFYDIYPETWINLEDGDPQRPRFVFLRAIEDIEPVW